MLVAIWVVSRDGNTGTMNKSTANIIECVDLLDHRVSICLELAETNKFYKVVTSIYTPTSSV